jgi:transposase
MKKKKRKAGGDRKPPRTRAYPVEFRLRIVKLFLEEGYSVALISEEFGISHHSIRRWVRAYRRGGVDGLTPKPRPGGKPCVKPEIQERVIAVKKTHPEYGARRITDVLKRFFLIPTSQTTVHKTLSEKGMVNKVKRKPVRNPPKPRFFERARPNQMWQSDIMTYRLAGRNAAGRAQRLSAWYLAQSQVYYDFDSFPLYDLNRGIQRGTDLRYCSYFFPNVFSK